MASDMPAPSLLLALPDPCLLAVLQCSAVDDQRSFFSAARVHSRLHQAAAMVLRSVTAHCNNKKQVDSVLLYLRNHAQHVDSVKLIGKESATVNLRQLPQNLQLNSLKLQHICLQLGRAGFQGMLGAAALAALKQLRLKDCELVVTGGDKGLAAALSQLPAGLEHLSVSGGWGEFPIGVLPRLLQLTYLELFEVGLQIPEEIVKQYGSDDYPDSYEEEAEDSDEGPVTPLLQPLHGLTRLVDLRLGAVPSDDAGNFPRVLSSMQNLTRLELTHDMQEEVDLEPDILAGSCRTKLQHLQLAFTGVFGGAAGVAKLLSYLQPLQQLTHLDLNELLNDVGSPPAAAYSALTASSKLQHLDIGWCCLPPGAWQHVFPTGRQLPHLTSLNISEVGEPLEGSRLVSCCPGLQSLNASRGRAACRPEFLVSLQGLSGLHTLHWTPAGGSAADALQAVCQLTGLRELEIDCHEAVEEGLMQLTQLKQLTSLYYYEAGMNLNQVIRLSCEVPGDEPVWRQVLRRYLEHSDPEVAQQATAALAE